MSDKCCGPGYASPMDAMKNGPREKLLYVVTVQPNRSEAHGDYLSTIDVDPESSTYCQVIHRNFTNKKEDELHHSGWNACSSCYNLHSSDKKHVPKRDKLILPALNSNNIYIFDVASNPRKPEIYKEISGDVLLANDVSAPHTTHCLANGNIMISTMGDRKGDAKGDFILFNKNFECIGTWLKTDECHGRPKFGYDFWYQPYFNVMTSTEWGPPNVFKNGFNPAEGDKYGHSMHFYNWKEQRLVQTIDLGSDGHIPLEVRFLHDPKKCEGYVGCAANSNLFYFHKKHNDEKFYAKKVVDVPAKKVTGWLMEDLNGLMADILISLDDKYLYLNNWLHGDVRQYDITKRDEPKLVSQVFLGGIPLSDDNIKVIKDDELQEQPKPTVIKERRLEGGPQMLQLSLDGKRLYVSSSLYSPWDKQFYPKMVEKGGHIVRLDIDIENGGMTLNKDFLVDFQNEPYGPTLPHEMRYPGGDCTSDIWLASD